MTYRGVYRDGIVILDTQVDLRNGEPVEVSPASHRPKKQARGAVARSKPSKDSTRRAKSAPATLPGFGMWKDRWPKSMTSAEVSRRLRAEVSRRLR